MNLRKLSFPQEKQHIQLLMAQSMNMTEIHQLFLLVVFLGMFSMSMITIFGHTVSPMADMTFSDAHYKQYHTLLESIHHLFIEIN